MPMEDTSKAPLTETSFLILLSLFSSPKHGYAIIKEVEKMSEGRVTLAAGTLYTALRRMLEDQWIERVEDPDQLSEGRERKLYRLSGAGRNILHLETQRLKSLVELAVLRKALGEKWAQGKEHIQAW
jgi:DNA-binding PadR family transcriptional regulator